MKHAGMRQEVLRLVLDACPVPMALNDNEQHILLVNREFTRVFGYTVQEIPNLEQWGLKAYPDAAYREDVLSQWSAHLRQAHETGQNFKPFEVHVRAQNGEQRSVMAGAACLAQVLEGVHLVVLYDITENVRTQHTLEASRQVLQSVVDTIPLRVFWKDEQLRYLGCNIAFARDAGVADPQVLVGKTDFELAWSHMAELYRADDREVIQSGQAKLAYEEPQVTPQGGEIWARTSKVPLHDSDGRTMGVLGVFEDITSQKQAAEQLRLAAMVFEHSSEGLLVTDADNHVVAVNPAFTKLTGYATNEVLGQDPRLWGSERQSAEFYQQMWEALERTGHWQGEIWNRRKNGELMAVWMTINTIYEAHGGVHRRVVLFSDISEKKQSEELIWQQANFDALTHLPNRRMFHDRLEQELRKAHRSGKPLALLFIDLDRFKDINDTLGHGAGDLLLVEAAKRIGRCVREADTVARMGGDEFTVILPELGSEHAAFERTAEAILTSLAQPFELLGQVVYISASIGIALYPNDSSEMAELVRHADQAMYMAKNEGRNRFAYFTKSMQEAAQQRLRLLSDLREALVEQQFELHYQPIIDLTTGGIQKTEALLRWRHPQHGEISPATLIPLAEETGLIHPLGEWVFQEVLRQIQCWRAGAEGEIQVSLNLSPVQFKGEARTGEWVKQLKSAGLNGFNVAFEITEGALLDASSTVRDQLLELRDVGVQVALDDFGTGYSSLSYLKKFHIDYLKIDQSFIRNLATDDNDKVLTEAMIGMAHKLGLKVIAEGVETEAQHDILRMLGCDFGQGYLFSRPLPAAAFGNLLRNRAQTGLSLSSTTTTGA